MERAVASGFDRGNSETNTYSLAQMQWHGSRPEYGANWKDGRIRGTGPSGPRDRNSSRGPRTCVRALQRASNVPGRIAGTGIGLASARSIGKPRR